MCVTYLFFSSAVSFIVAEQFGEAIEMKAITKAAKYLFVAYTNNEITGGNHENYT